MYDIMLLKSKHTKHPERFLFRMEINFFMIDSLFFILTLIWALQPERFSTNIILQLVLAVPMLFVSCLAYSKADNKGRFPLFKRFGWITSTAGNNLVLNAVGLMTFTFHPEIAFAYFATLIPLVVVYYSLNMFYDLHSLREELLKLSFILIIILLGGVLPMFF